MYSILVYKMQERHNVLERTIGYLDEEQEALDRGYFLLIGSAITVIVGSLLQIFSFTCTMENSILLPTS